jgi:hypothetical protein
MDNSKNPTGMNSRRSFTKWLMASLVAAPVVANLLSCRRPSQTETAPPSPQATPPTRLPAIVECTGGVSTKPHEPPIGFSDGGSLIIDIPESNRISFGMGSGPRPHNHTLGTANYTSIQEVGVLTRPTDEHPPFFALYRLPPNPTYQLRLWLVQLEDPPSQHQNNYEEPGDEPQLILRATAPHIETERQLGRERVSHKVSVPLRHDYPTPGRHFHIGKWQITEADGTIVKDASTQKLFQGEGDDSYEIYVTFNHPH